MFRIWLLIWYLDKYKDPNRGEHWVLQAKPTQSIFVHYLAHEKHFIEDVRDTFLRYFYNVINRNRPQSKLGSKLAQKQLKDINDVVKNCIYRKLIQSNRLTPHATSMEITLWADNKSREFLRPLRFLNALFGDYEYGKIIAFILGIVTGLLGVFYKSAIKIMEFFNS